MKYSINRVVSCYIFMTAISLFAASSAAKTVYETSKEIQSAMIDVCTKDVSDKNMFCAAAVNRAMSVYLEFCSSLMENNNGQAHGEADLCKSATIEDYNLWYENKYK